jgi:hypothetical protein
MDFSLRFDEHSCNGLLIDTSAAYGAATHSCLLLCATVMSLTREPVYLKSKALYLCHPSQPLYKYEH